MESVTAMNEHDTQPSVWAVGDVHGEIGHLTALLSALPRKPQDTTVFLGDYIDRGPDSAGVVRRVLAEYEAAPERTVLLWGNHEDMAASHFGFAAPSGFVYNPKDWFDNGGTQAMHSYGYLAHEAMTAPCPPDLARLFPLLQPFWRTGEGAYPELSHCIWVHAGVLPGQPVQNAHGETLLWVRDEFLNVTDPSGRLVIHGHTPFRSVRVLPDKIGIDTGAVFGGRLSALQLPQRRVFQANARGQVVSFDLPPAFTPT